MLNAVAHRTHFGYSGQGNVEHGKHESPAEYLTLCVELIGERSQLEQFCQKQAAMLHDKVVVYEKLERWDVGMVVTGNAGEADEAT